MFGGAASTVASAIILKEYLIIQNLHISLCSLVSFIHRADI